MGASHVWHPVTHHAAPVAACAPSQRLASENEQLQELQDQSAREMTHRMAQLGEREREVGELRVGAEGATGRGAREWG